MSAFWKPGEAGPTLDAEVEKFESANTTTFHYNPNVSRDVKRQRLLLPIAHFREAILYHVSNFLKHLLPLMIFHHLFHLHTILYFYLTTQ